MKAEIGGKEGKTVFEASVELAPPADMGGVCCGEANDTYGDARRPLLPPGPRTQDALRPGTFVTSIQDEGGTRRNSVLARDFTPHTAKYACKYRYQPID